MAPCTDDRSRRTAFLTAIRRPDNVLHYKTCVNISLLNTESGTFHAYKIILGRKIQTITKI